MVDTPLAESGIIGAAVGLAMAGLKPVPEIQFEGFLAPDELTAAQEALWLHFPRPEDYFADPSAHHGYGRSQFDGLRVARRGDQQWGPGT